MRHVAGTPSVVSLLASNPFSEHPPSYVRAVLYDYRFVQEQAQNSSPNTEPIQWWWRKSCHGPFGKTQTLNGAIDQIDSDDVDDSGDDE